MYSAIAKTSILNFIYGLFFFICKSVILIVIHVQEDKIIIV